MRKTYWYPATTAAEFAAVVEDLHFATRLDKSVVMDELIKAAIKARPQVVRALAKRGGRVPGVPAPTRVPSLSEHPPMQASSLSEPEQRDEG
ncbi:hypothetical protein AB0M94_39570 [Streptomyces xanthochromogenes]|uniref:hypothetical protein n=1 Tax=Streptomyces xanthochromogenes TaxID=67384 RepID=UPI00343B06CC